MKRIFAATLLLIIGFSFLTGCGVRQKSSNGNEIEQPYISIPDFSYAEESTLYVDGKPGVKTSGFVNTTETEINLDNLTQIAKRECTLPSDNLNVSWYQDSAARIWKVVFFTGGELGGCQTVYLDYSGRTVLIVYGE